MMKKNLNDNKIIGAVAIFKDDGRFIWQHLTGNITGTFTITKDTIVLLKKGEKKELEVHYRFADKNLILKTPDGFTFTFVKKN